MRVLLINYLLIVFYEIYNKSTFKIKRNLLKTNLVKKKKKKKISFLKKKNKKNNK